MVGHRSDSQSCPAKCSQEACVSVRIAAAKREVELRVKALIAAHAADHAQLVSAVRQVVRKRLPTAFEIVYEYRSWIVISYSPSDNGHDGVLALRADADVVKFYFNRGKDLPDTERMLKGKGGLVRFIEVETAATLGLPAVKALIEEAIARSVKPFAVAGRGSVIIRSAATKKTVAKTTTKTTTKTTKVSNVGRPASPRAQKKSSRR